MKKILVTSVISTTSLLWTNSAFSDDRYTAITEASKVVTEIADDMLTKLRSERRLANIKGKLTYSIRNLASVDEKFSLEFRPELVLCSARAEQVDIVGANTVLKTVSSKISGLNKQTKIEGTVAAIKILFKNYNLEFDEEINQEGQVVDVKRTVVNRCRTDLANFDQAYFGDQVRSNQENAPSGLAIFSAVGSFLKLFKQLFEPVIVGGVELADEAKRNAAITRFLQDPDNRKKIDNASTELTKYVSNFVWQKRLQLAGDFNHNLASLESVQIDLSKSKSCKALVEPGASVTGDATINYIANGSTVQKKEISGQFILCWNDAWKQVKTSAKATITSAAVYDEFADAGDSDNIKKAVQKLNNSIDNVANNSMSVEQVWTVVAKLISYGEKVQTAFKKENRDKIKESVDAIFGD